jgi:hypothetical protein
MGVLVIWECWDLPQLGTSGRKSAAWKLRGIACAQVLSEVDSILSFVRFTPGTTADRVLVRLRCFGLRADQHDDAEHDSHVMERRGSPFGFSVISSSVVIVVAGQRREVNLSNWQSQLAFAPHPQPTPLSTEARGSKECGGDHRCQGVDGLFMAFDSSVWRASYRLLGCRQAFAHQ